MRATEHHALRSICLKGLLVTINLQMETSSSVYELQLHLGDLQSDTSLFRLCPIMYTLSTRAVEAVDVSFMGLVLSLDTHLT
jgi:hypothetical protein